MEENVVIVVLESSTWQQIKKINGTIRRRNEIDKNEMNDYYRGKVLGLYYSTGINVEKNI
jgi:hypothetical protein